MKSLSIILITGLAVFGFVLERKTKPPVFASFEEVKTQVSSSEFEIFDRREQLLSSLRDQFHERRLSWVELKEIPPRLIEMLSRAEDRRFQAHQGVDFKALVASVWQSLRPGGARRGGSTLTMQLARWLEPDLFPRTIFGKIRQIRSALTLEKSWSKAQILEAYLNLVGFRGETRGLQAASRQLLRKDVSGLNEDEIAFLVVLLRSPQAGSERVVQRICRFHPSSCPRAKELVSQAFANRPLTNAKNEAFHFARWVRPQVSGARVFSTIDAELQAETRRILHSTLLALQKQNVRDGAVLVLHNSTGEVLAYVGSSGTLSRSPQVDGVQARRQAGSTLKPFLYAWALEKNYLKPDSWLQDSPLEIVFPTGAYRPLNHDRQFHGWVRAGTALGSSLNVPAVRLLQLVGVDSFWTQLRRLGFRQLEESSTYGPALALGVADVSLWDLTNGYRSLAQQGVWSEPRWNTKAPKSQQPSRRVFQKQTAEMIEEILSSKENRSLSFGFSSVLENKFPAAVKTGTSKDMRDNWAVGWSRDYTVGVWVGNFEGDPMWDVSGVSGAAPIWSQVLNWLHDKRSSQGGDRPRSSPQEQGLSRPLAQKNPQEFPRIRILYPPPGLALAWDPEIPPSKQVLPLQAETAGRKDLRWRVGRRDLGEANSRSPSFWPLERGRHRLDLVEEKNGRVVESTEILVR